MKFLLMPLMAIALLCISHSINAQDQFILPQLSPRSPNAAAIEKYGEIPVSLSNGTANVSIPLYTIRCGSLEIPVQLQYNYNGLKMDEIPSFTGLGWSLQAGGLINYEQRGLPDFSLEGTGMFTNGTYHAQDSLRLFLNHAMPPDRSNAYLQMLSEGWLDGEYDFYNYAFPGYQGSFYFDKDQKIIMVPENNLKASRHGDSFFIITDEKGNKWYFNVSDRNIAGPDPESQQVATRGFNGSASIYLSSVQSTSNRSVKFAYAPYPFSYTITQTSVSVMSERPYADCPGSRLNTDQTHYYLENNLLREIIFEEGRILFEMSTEPRKDIGQLSPGAFVPYLSRMQVLDRNNQPILEYGFHYTNGNRLQLDGITKTSATGAPIRWTFRYEGTQDYPKPFSKGKDHWGYYNGKGRGIPQADYATLVPGWKNNAVTVNRESNFAFGKTGLLRSIQYPTGGSATLEYEPNSIVFTRPSQLSGKYFLDYKYPSVSIPIIKADTDSLSELEGYFTLDSVTQVEISAHRAFQPKALINSVVILQKAGNPVNLLTALFRYDCSPYACALFGKAELGPGRYRYFLKRSAQDLDEVGGNARLTINKKVPVTVPVAASRYTIGGGRVVSIRYDDSAGNSLMKRYQYNDHYEDLGFTNMPQYISRTAISVNHFAACSRCGIRSNITEESQLPMTGNPVEYLEITEFPGKDSSNGSTVYRFSGTEDFYGGGSSPYLHPFKLNWRAGLVSQKTYRYNAGTMQLVMLDSNDHISVPIQAGITRGIKACYSDYCPIPGPGFNYFNYQLPTYFTERFYCKTSTQQYFDSSGSLLTRKEFIPGSSRHTLPTELRTFSKAGILVKEKISYSFDYDTLNCISPEAKGIRCLQRNHMLLPVEKLTISSIDGVDHITAATLLTYKADTPVPDRIFEIRLPEPLPLHLFNSSHILAGNFNKDSRYAETVYFKQYDRNLNLLEALSPGQPARSWQWLPYQQHPICEATGATQDELAYTSFEAEEPDSWKSKQPYANAIIKAPKPTTALSFSLMPNPAYSVTGNNSWDLGKGSLYKSGPGKGRSYILSYWSRAGAQSISGASSKITTGNKSNGWTYFEHSLVITGDTIVLSGTGLIDELRLYPPGASINTYTYTPLVGLSSACDSNNRIMYYEYDDQGRLMHIRDGKRNIRKKMEYNYADRK